MYQANRPNFLFVGGAVGPLVSIHPFLYYCIWAFFVEQPIRSPVCGTSYDSVFIQ